MINPTKTLRNISLNYAYLGVGIESTKYVIERSDISSSFRSSRVNAMLHNHFDKIHRR